MESYSGILHKTMGDLYYWRKTTKPCHLLKMLPAATQRLSLCKTDICLEAFFCFHSPSQFFLVHNLKYNATIFTSATFLRILISVSLSVHGQVKDEQVIKYVFNFRLF